MDFQKTVRVSRYYTSLGEALQNQRRSELVEKSKWHIQELRDMLFDKYDIEEFHIIGDFVDKEKYDVDKIGLTFNMGKAAFEELVDHHLLDSCSLDCFIEVNNSFYHLEGRSWQVVDLPATPKVLLEKNYETKAHDFIGGRRSSVISNSKKTAGK
jgi:hypothetical protein